MNTFCVGLFKLLLLFSILFLPIVALANNFNSLNERLYYSPIKHIYAADELIGTVRGEGLNAKIQYIHGDHLSGSNVISGVLGNIEEITDYFPFGKIRFDLTAGSSKESRKFTGHNFDQETDLTYAKARYFDGKTAKFFSQDPAVISLMNEKDKEELLSNPQMLNSYSYAVNNPLKYVDPDGKKVELVDRRVPGSLIGVHSFLMITPDNPSEINISGLPQNTSQFTIGGYNKGGVLGIGNVLEKDLGFVGDPTPNTDLPHLLGQREIINKTVIVPPDGQSDTEFINNLGKSFNSVQTGQKYFSLGQVSVFNYGNSNNTVYEIGSRAGIGNQIDSHKIGGLNWAPGINRNLPTTNSIGMIKNQIEYIKTSIQKIWTKK